MKPKILYGRAIIVNQCDKEIISLTVGDTII